MSVVKTCRRCGAQGIASPKEVAQTEVCCSACGDVQPVREYFNDADRLRSAAMDMMRAKSEYADRLHKGVVCSQCGGTTALPTDPNARDFACQYCGTRLMVASYVDGRVIAGANLRAGIDATFARAQEQDRKRNLLIFGVSTLVAAILLIGVLLTR